MEVTLGKERGSRLGIYLRQGTSWGHPTVVARDDHVTGVCVNDVVSRVNGRRYWNTRAVASAIVRSGPTVTLTVERRDLFRPLIAE